MSDHDAAPDPIDNAYARAEAMLDDPAARAARRARVLDAVAADADADADARPAAPPAPKRRPSWTAGAWLAAASVAGISALVAVYQSSTPPVQLNPPPPPPQAPVAEPAAEPATDAPPPAAAPAVKAAPPPAPAPAIVEPRAGVVPPADMVVAAPPPPPAPPALSVPRQNRVEAPPVIVTGQPKVSAPSAPAPAPAAAEGQVDALIVTGQKREEDIQDVPVGIPAFNREEAARNGQAAKPAASSAQAVRLRRAAAHGDLAGLNAALAQGVPVDAQDSNGETALMKAIRGRRPDAAALLIRHGASLDRENRAGVSAREMAQTLGDSKMDRALGLAR